MTIAILTILLIILVFLGVPITWSLGFTGFVGLLMLGSNPLTLIPQSIYNGVVYFPLLAIPFYIFAGEIMNRGGITKKLVDLSSLIVGRVPGSLAYVNILCSMFFGGITGSAVADTSSIGSMLIPAMKTQGYKEDETVAVTVSSSIMGPIIPPSIIMVIYGSIMSINIGALFMGGIIPGILIGVALATVVAIRNRTQHFPVRTEKYTPAERKSILLNALIPLGMPIIIMGGILGGIFTATEAGCVAVIYSVIVSVFVLKTVKLKELRGMLLSTAKTTGTVLIIIGCSKTLSWSLTLLQVQQSLTYFFSTTISSSIAFLIVVNILYLILGCFMDPAAALIMFSPLLGPIAVHYGINPILFGLISCINLNIGNATPPLGQCLFVGCKVGKLSLGRVAKSIIPYLAAEIVVLLLVTYIPDISLILPRIAGLTS
jgi:tripartite ATP-independent transporter DctM subunit